MKCNGKAFRKKNRLEPITSLGSFQDLVQRLKSANALGIDFIIGEESDSFADKNEATGKLTLSFKRIDKEDGKNLNLTKGVISLLESVDEDFGGWIIDKNVNDPNREGLKTFSITQAQEDNQFGIIEINWNVKNNVTNSNITAQMLNASSTAAGTFTYELNGDPVVIGGQLNLGENRLTAIFTPTSSTSNIVRKHQKIILNLP